MRCHDPKYLGAAAKMKDIIVRLIEYMECPVCKVGIGVPCKDERGRKRLPHMVYCEAKRILLSGGES